MARHRRPVCIIRAALADGCQPGSGSLLPRSSDIRVSATVSLCVQSFMRHCQCIRGDRPCGTSSIRVLQAAIPALCPVRLCNSVVLRLNRWQLRCGLSGLVMCSECRVKCYCSATCQQEHWPIHRLTCFKNDVGDPLFYYVIDTDRPRPACK